MEDETIAHRTVELVKIDACPFNPRPDNAHERRSIDSLAKDIEMRGLLQPVRLRPMGDRFEVVFGHRRVAALRKLGREVVRAEVVSMSDDEALLVQLSENRERSDVHPVDEARSYACLASLGHDPEEIAKRLGETRRQVVARLAL